MRVAYIGLSSERYPRSEILRRGLRAAGADVVDLRIPRPLLPGHATGPGESGVSRRRLAHEADLARRFARRVAHVSRRLRTLPPVDAVVVAEFSQGLMPLALPFARARAVPVVADFLISLFDTAVNVRGSLGPRRPRALQRFAVDAFTLRTADRVLFDTEEQAEYYLSLFRADRRTACVLPVGVPDWEAGAEPPPPRDGRTLTVLFYGTYSPFHGVETIVGAARLLGGDERLRFVLVGSGQTHRSIRAAYERRPSGNVEFRPPAWGASATLLAEADIALGAFGSVPVTDRVVPNKVWEALAAARPVVTGDGKALRGLLEPGRHLLAVPPGNPEALAGAIRRLADDEAHASALAEAGGRHVYAHYSSTALGSRLLSGLEELKRRGRSGVP